MGKTMSGVKHLLGMVPYVVDELDEIDSFRTKEFIEQIRAEIKDGKKVFDLINQREVVETNIFEDLIQRFLVDNQHVLKLQHLPREKSVGPELDHLQSKIKSNQETSAKPDNHEVE